MQPEIVAIISDDW